MEIPAATRILSTLGHEGRLTVFRLLARRAPQGLRPGEISALCGVKSSTLSAHLSALTEAGLIEATRAGTSIYYALNRDRMAEFSGFLFDDCCQWRPEICLRDGKFPGDRMPKVLFLCTGNSARSILAEALLRKMGRGRVSAYSAGLHPAGAIHPAALDILAKHGIEDPFLASKSTDEVGGQAAPNFDLILTLCDRAVDEEHIAWPGAPVRAHWGLPDPAEQPDIIGAVFETLRTRIAALADLPLARLNRATLQREADRIGLLEAG